MMYILQYKQYIFYAINNMLYTLLFTECICNVCVYAVRKVFCAGKQRVSASLNGVQETGTSSSLLPWMSHVPLGTLCKMQAYHYLSQ